MNRAWLRQHGKGSLELVEEAFHLLRRAPAPTLACYYVGALPFVLGLLYFWADMGRSPFAQQRLAGAALGMALLFLWMKCWQAVFARRLRALAAGAPPPRWDVRGGLRLLAVQTILQPSGLFLLPVALVAMLPFGWAYAYYQNVTALGDGESSEVKPLFQKARQQCSLWPRQNHGALAALAGFGLCVFLNWISAGYTLPFLLKMFLGIETVVTKSPASLLNSTFLATMLALTYLSVDPLVKAVFALRCFYGESLQSGEDLRSELRSSAAGSRMMAACLACALGLIFTGAAAQTHSPVPGGTALPRNDFASVAVNAESPATQTDAPATAPDPQGRAPTSPPPPAAFASAELDRAIGDVLQQRKYAWRMPREKVDQDEAEPGFIARFFNNIWTWTKEKLRQFSDWLNEMLDRLFRRQTTRRGSGTGWITPLQGLMFVLIAVTASILGILIFRLVRNRRKSEAATALVIQTAPDLADENVGADQLPEDGWMQLGRELLGRGEWRLALRAFYLSGLAHLAERNLITLAKFKSNHDYERELRRRAHAFPELLPAFGEAVVVFDRVWYGRHEADADLVGRFLGNVERIRTAG